MKIPVPVEVPEEDQMRYCEIFRAGYLTMTRRHPYSENTRAHWPEAYDAGQTAGYQFLNQSTPVRRKR